MTDQLISEYWHYPLALGDTLTSNDWVEWHFHKFLESRFLSYALAEQRRADIGTAIILWSACYRQDPAGTLPDDDVELARIAGFGPDLAGWKEARPRVLYGWKPCSVDTPHGAVERLGHEVIAGVAFESWKRKAGKVQGRAAQRLAVMRSRVRKVMQKVGLSRQADVPDVVEAITNWLDQGNLFVTEENVRAGAVAAAGVPDLRPIKGGARL